ncbi:MAG: RNA 2',3'-cyclic phosphodiesterase [Planctomycetes bacterium]|nr:RNA 2',3'-cyclic phosphodiesterase [Planctomycetota bacterium]
MGVLRTFVAVEFDEPIRDRLTAMQDRLRESKADVRWVGRDALHVTLKFCGEIAEETLPAVGSRCTAAAAAHRPGRVTVKGLGVFPPRGEPRILWAGVDDPAGICGGLAETLEEGMLPLGILREDRPFLPHLTIGRVRTPKGLDRLVKTMESEKAADFGTCHLREIVLFKSELHPGGARYTALGRYPLKAD